MNRNEIRAINEEVLLATYARNKIKAAGNTIADLVGKIDLAEELLETDKIDESTYKDFVAEVRVECKTLVAEIYGFMHLSQVEGHFDHVFENHEHE